MGLVLHSDAFLGIFLAEFKGSPVILGGSWDLVSKVISTLTGVISIVTLFISLLTKSHDPLSTGASDGKGQGGAGPFLRCHDLHPQGCGVADPKSPISLNEGIWPNMA